MMNRIMRRVYPDYLSLPNTNCIKGVFALFILTHHLYQHSGLFRETVFSIILQGLGYLSVAVFFFLSGYGLQISHKTKGNRYVKEIPCKRILPLYLQCLFLIVIYAVLYIAIGKELKIEDILQSVLWGNTIIVNGWYLQAILVMYFIYYIVYTVIGRNKAQCSAKLQMDMLIILIVYALLNIFCGKTITRYQSIFAFVLGIVWCDYKDRIDRILTKNWLVCVSTIFASFAILFIAGLKLSFITIFAALAFVILVMLLLMKIPVNCFATRWLGKYYFEIYVMQGIGLMLFHSSILYIENKWLYVIACTVTTLFLSVSIQPFFRYISNSIKKT